jgi:23S rRNA (cytidine1920-2'-O)/16S rRNA (cytidine1409-2'-O)-methyltransferase
VKRTKIKLDVRIVRDGLAEDLTEARALIMAGKALVSEQRVDKPGTLVADDQEVRIRDKRRFVSRGGEKLWGAVQDLGLQDLFKDAVVLDCGASTGGFSDCALQLGARRVHAVEMGFNQLAWSLRTDPRVQVREGCDVRSIEGLLDPEIRIVLADISFNSLDRLLPAMRKVVPAQGVTYLLLCKPQFELADELVPVAGVVENPGLRAEALAIVEAAMKREGLVIRRTVDSRVRGREGNQEVFVLAD